MFRYFQQNWLLFAFVFKRPAPLMSDVFYIKKADCIQILIFFKFFKNPLKTLTSCIAPANVFVFLILTLAFESADEVVALLCLELGRLPDFVDDEVSDWGLES